MAGNAVVRRMAFAELRSHPLNPIKKYPGESLSEHRSARNRLARMKIESEDLHV